MHAEMDAIDSIVASLPDEDRDTAFHRQCPACPLFVPLNSLQRIVRCTLPIL